MLWFNNLYQFFSENRLFLPFIFLTSFGITCPVLAEKGKNLATVNSTYSKNVEALTTVRGMCGSRILPVFNNDGQLIGYVGVFSEPIDTNTSLFYINPEGVHLDSTEVDFVKNGEPPSIGPAIVNLEGGPLGAVCSYKTIIIIRPDNQGAVTFMTYTLPILGNFSKAPVLKVNAQSQVEITAPADSYNVDLRHYEAYVNKLIFNPNDSSITTATGNWPAKFNDAAFGIDGPGQSDTITISPITSVGQGVPLRSSLYSLGSRGDTLWSDSIGLAMTKGPALYSRGDSLCEITVGAVDVFGGKTY